MVKSKLSNNAIVDLPSVSTNR